MLRFLRIRNLAVIEAVEVELESGFNVLTGETGAGKSILVEAVGLLLGGRASGGPVRTGGGTAAIGAALREGGRVAAAGGGPPGAMRPAPPAREARLDLIAFHLADLDRAAPSAGEDDELSAVR